MKTVMALLGEACGSRPQRRSADARPGGRWITGAADPLSLRGTVEDTVRAHERNFERNP